MQDSMHELEGIWEEFFSGNPFDTFFLGDFYDRQYRIEKQLGITVGFFAVLGIVIAALGLFGLSSFTTIQRTKEIGIRKVNGASPRRILYLIAKDFLLLIILSVIIASPVTWLVIKNWLEIYPYQAPVHWWVFILTGILELIIAMTAVSFETLRAANKNPAESLKYE